MTRIADRGARFLFFVFPVLLFAAAIFYVSSIEKITLPALGISFEDKLFHMIAYFVFGWLMLRALQYGRTEHIPRKLIFLAIFIGLLYGLSDEIHQYFVPGRSSEFWDWLADAIGVVLGCAFYRWFHRVEMQLVNFATKNFH